MSIFGDYKSYRKYQPSYAVWKHNRNLMEAKRDAYLKLHPELVNQEDIQRGQILLRSIDIMDEYSQKKAENMEAVTESVIGFGLEIALFSGAALGGLLGSIKPIGRFFQRFAAKGSKHEKLISLGIPAGIGAIIGTIAAFPLMAWGAKAEVSASRKGRFEAMRKELSHPNGFAVLTDEEKKLALENAKKVILEDDKKKNVKTKISNGFSSIKDMAVDSKEYKEQRRQFEKELAYDEQHLEKQMNEHDIINAKRDQQLLTKLVEKIDIASQDYAENSELAVQNAVITIGATGGILSIGTKKVLTALKIKSANKIDLIVKGLSALAFLGTAAFSAQINKQASRVGRFKAKQELMQNPNNFVYVDDEKLKDINVQVKPNKKLSMFKFLKNAWKDNKEFEKYKKTAGKEERKYFKAVESINLSEQQLADAKKLQTNTFRTFNKIDENTQKYAESIEALGQSIAFPINTICSLIGITVGLKYLMRKPKNQLDSIGNGIKYFTAVLISNIPAMIINSIITKEQKQASRIASMISIEELNDYRKFG